MWIQLHSHLDDSLYRKEWLGDHKQILAALIKKRCPSGEAGNVAASGKR